MVHRDDIFSVIVSPQALRTAHYEFLSQIRLTDYQCRFDTITVSEKLVADAKHFFKLMSTVTSDRAFQETLSFSNRSGRAQIDSPQWLERLENAYLTVWIAGLLEENLWAHFNNAHNINVEKNVRKNDL
jgi:Holliday junction resolvase-like predicted endonuclease